MNIEKRNYDNGIVDGEGWFKNRIINRVVEKIRVNKGLKLLFCENSNVK